MTSLLDALRAGLRAVGDPGKAPDMQRYAKSAMPFLGVSAVPMRAVCRALFRDLRWDTSAQWQADVLAIWRGAAYHEERYAAIELTGVRAARAFQRMDALPMYEDMVVTGAWWDLVDGIATQRLPLILAQAPVAMKAMMRDWVRVGQSLEAALRDPLPDQGQAGDGPRLAA